MTVLNLQSLRGIACLMVVYQHLHHFESKFGQTPLGFDVIRWFGFAGVDLFFVLSGFVLTYAHHGDWGHPSKVPSYFKRRLWRIYPLYWVALAIAALIYWSTNGAETFQNWRSSVVGWVLATSRHHVLIGPAWSLAYEMMFYIALGAAMLFPARIGKLILVLWAFAVIVCWGANVEAGVVVKPFVLEFLAGCLISELILRGVYRGPRIAIALGFLFLFTSGLITRILTEGDWAVIMANNRVRVAIFGPWAGLVVYGLAAGEKRMVIRLPRILEKFGDASYSIYLIHEPVQHAAMFLGYFIPHTRLPHLTWIALTAVVSIGAGFLLHFVAERPIIACMRRRKRSLPEKLDPNISGSVQKSHDSMLKTTMN